MLRAMRSSAVYNVAEKSQLELAPMLSARAGCNVLLKREDQQSVRSFKLRGAYEKMSRLTARECARGVIAASAGNHAQGVALAARQLGTSALIVVPTPTPQIKRDMIRSLGAELEVAGDTFDDAYHVAVERQKETGRVFIHPYDDEDVIIGQGTIGLELFGQCESFDSVFVPVGGGGLISGIALAVKQTWPSIKVYGVETEDSAAMHTSLRAKERITLPTVGLLADGCAVRQVGSLTFELVSRWVDDVITVTNDELCAAVQDIFECRRAFVEPAGALGYAGIKKLRPGRDKTAIAIVTGANVNFDRLQYIAETARVGRHSEALFAIRIPEKPGQFRTLCHLIENRSLTEFNYRYGNSERAVVFVGVSTASVADRENLLDRFTDAGFEAHDLTDDEVARLHLRHLAGGRVESPIPERVFRMQFPERPGALAGFLDRVAGRWNISLFHYRNHGADRGRALLAFQVPPAQDEEFRTFVDTLGADALEVTQSLSTELFLNA